MNANSPFYLLNQVKFDGQSILVTPTSKFFSLVERYSVYPLMRQKLFLKLDKGLIGVFFDDLKITPNWRNANEIISLKNKKIEIISHKKIIRLRKYLTKIHLIDEKNPKIRREFFFKGEGENDPELLNIMNHMKMHINYANALVFRYHFHYLESLGLLYKPSALNSSTATPKDKKEINKEFTDYLNISTLDVNLQVYVPEPMTSDDDSDQDDFDNDHEDTLIASASAPSIIPTAPPNIPGSRAGTAPAPAPGMMIPTAPPGGGGAGGRKQSFVGGRKTVTSASAPNTPASSESGGNGAYYRVIKNKSQPFVTLLNLEVNNGSSNTPNQNRNNNNNNLSEENDSDDDANSQFSHSDDIYDIWQKKLSEKFGWITKNPFDCRLYFLEELDLILFFQDYKIISIMKVSKCLEKDRFKKLLNKSNNQGNKKNGLKIVNRPNIPPTASTKTMAGLNTTNTNSRVASTKSDSNALGLTSALLASTSQRGGPKGGVSTGISSKIYSIESEDEDEDDNNSDRDYLETEDFQNLLQLKKDGLSSDSNSSNNNSNNNNNNATSISLSLTTITGSYNVKILGHDGRTYRMRFTHKFVYEKVQKFFLSRSIKPIIKKEKNDGSSELPEIIYDMDATKKYSRLLKSNEKLLAAGIVLKHEKIMPISAMSTSTREAGAATGFIPPKQRRILLITDSPRLMFIDTIGNIVRGHLELQSEMKTDVRLVISIYLPLSVCSNPFSMFLLD